jgi:hypothetical protein
MELSWKVMTSASMTFARKLNGFALPVGKSQLPDIDV